MTEAIKDEKKRMLTLKTIYKELTMQVATETEYKEMITLVTQHSLEKDFNKDYGIIKYIGSNALGRMFLCEDREELTNHMAFIVEQKKLLEDQTQPFYCSLLEKFSAEMCKSREIEPSEHLILVKKVYVTSSNLIFLYDHDQFSIPLSSLIASDDIKTDEVLSLMKALAISLNYITANTDQYMQEIDPRCIMLYKDHGAQSILVKLMLSFLPSASKDYLDFIGNSLYFNPMMLQPADHPISDLPFNLSYTYSLFALIFKMVGTIDVFEDHDDFLFEEEDMKQIKNIAQKVGAKLAQFSNRSRKCSIIVNEFKELIQGFAHAGDDCINNFSDMLDRVMTENPEETSYEHMYRTDAESDHEK